MAATKPMLSADEAAAMASTSPSSLQQQEQELLDALVGLLLEGRYFPLSAQEWEVAQRHEFTFGEFMGTGEAREQVCRQQQQGFLSSKTSEHC
jgi:hypothetical protein